MTMKKLLKAILPKPILNTVRDVRDCGRLACVGKLEFNPANLLQQGTFNLNFIFNSKTFESGWKEDHAAISDLFGDDDRFGGINPGDRRALYYLIRAMRSRNVLEVGTHIGASTLYIARALKNNGDGSVTTVDIADVNAGDGAWRKVGLPIPPRDFADKLGCRGPINFVTQASLDFINKTDKKFDFIFLDGDHAARTVYREVAAALRILNPGGVILLHDFYPEGKALFPDNNVISGPFLALSRIIKESPGIAVQPLGDLPWETKQGVHATSLALLTKSEPS